MTGVREYTEDHPGHPLGIGMPTGAPLREDGESHYEAWQRILRSDPCAFCGEPGGTVDHIEPKSMPVHSIGGAHSWLNLAGACERCNGAKAVKPLWYFLWTRCHAPLAGGRLAHRRPAPACDRARPGTSTRAGLPRTPTMAEPAPMV